MEFRKFRKFRKREKVIFFNFREGWGFVKKKGSYLLVFGDREMYAYVARYKSLRELKLNLLHDRIRWQRSI
jgi:hypothetical protein